MTPVFSSMLEATLPRQILHQTLRLRIKKKIKLIKTGFDIAKQHMHLRTKTKL